jgi:uroporphyrinogen-III decarboxylase
MAIIEPEFMELTRGFDPAAFWAENERCTGEGTDKPRCPAGVGLDDHWLFEFVSPPSTVRYYHDKPYRDALHREANAVLRQHVGRAYFSEDTWEHQPRRIEELFGCGFAYLENATPWLTHVTEDPDEFARVLDRVEATDLRAFTFPEPYLVELEQRLAAGQPRPHLGGGGRGPATIMTSVIRPDICLMWFYEHPELMERFRDLLTAKLIEHTLLVREFSRNPGTGFFILDDNCALFSAELYREFCFPVLDRFLDAVGSPRGSRYQHSDSAMAHLLDLQRELGMRGVNYGPEIDVALIREKLPDARIDGHMPPFLLRNGTPGQIEQRVKDDFRKAGATGRLNVTTAGSLAAGTGVGRIRFFFQCVERHCRYDA